MEVSNQCMEYLLKYNIWDNDMNLFRKKFKMEMFKLHPDKLMHLSETQKQAYIELFKMLTNCRGKYKDLNEYYKVLKPKIQEYISTHEAPSRAKSPPAREAPSRAKRPTKANPKMSKATFCKLFSNYNEFVSHIPMHLRNALRYQIGILKCIHSDNISYQNQPIIIYYTFTYDKKKTLSENESYIESIQIHSYLFFNKHNQTTEINIFTDKLDNIKNTKSHVKKMLELLPTKQSFVIPLSFTYYNIYKPYILLILSKLCSFVTIGKVIPDTLSILLVGNQNSTCDKKRMNLLLKQIESITRIYVVSNGKEPMETLYSLFKSFKYQDIQTFIEEIKHTYKNYKKEFDMLLSVLQHMSLISQ